MTAGLASVAGGSVTSASGALFEPTPDVDADPDRYEILAWPLEPGDVITTGTPQGVIMGMAEKHWLKPGDVVTVEVSGLGKLTNRMVSSA